MTTKEAFHELIHSGNPNVDRRTLHSWKKRLQDGTITTDRMEAILKENGYVCVPAVWKKKK